MIKCIVGKPLDASPAVSAWWLPLSAPKLSASSSDTVADTGLCMASVRDTETLRSWLSCCGAEGCALRVTMGCAAARQWTDGEPRVPD